MPPNASSSAFLKFNEDASMNILVSAMEIGQGFLTAMAQIAAEVLQIPPSKIRVETPDTDRNPYEWQTVASHITWGTGNAVRRAALAPAEPSSQDLRVAAAATTMETNAISELRELRELAQMQREQPVERPKTGEEGALQSEEAKAGAPFDGRQAGREQTEQPNGSGARERLEQRVAGFFADPPTEILSQFA